MALFAESSDEMNVRPGELHVFISGDAQTFTFKTITWTDGGVETVAVEQSRAEVTAMVATLQSVLDRPHWRPAT